MTKLETACKEYNEYMRMKKEIDAMTEKLKKEIFTLMKNRDRVELDNFICTRSTYNSSRFDSKRFKQEYPALYPVYQTETTATRLTVTAKH